MGWIGLFAALTSCVDVSPRQDQAGEPKSHSPFPPDPYEPAPDCTLQCQECAPLFADHYFCDPEGEVWFCDSSASACPDSPNTGWPRWTLVPAACDCVQEDGTLLDSAACEGAR